MANTQVDTEQIQKLLNIVEAHLSQLTQTPLEEKIANLSDVERAKFKTVLAYAMTTLSLCYLRSKGESVEGHTNMRHLDRLKHLFVKLDKYVDLSVK